MIEYYAVQRFTYLPWYVDAQDERAEARCRLRGCDQCECSYLYSDCNIILSCLSPKFRYLRRTQHASIIKAFIFRAEFWLFLRRIAHWKSSSAILLSCLQLCVSSVHCDDLRKEHSNVKSNFISKETLKLISRRNDIFQTYKRSGLAP